MEKIIEELNKRVSEIIIENGKDVVTANHTGLTSQAIGRYRKLLVKNIDTRLLIGIVSNMNYEGTWLLTGKGNKYQNNETTIYKNETRRRLEAENYAKDLEKKYIQVLEKENERLEQEIIKLKAQL